MLPMAMARSYSGSVAVMLCTSSLMHHTVCTSAVVYTTQKDTYSKTDSTQSTVALDQGHFDIYDCLVSLLVDSHFCTLSIALNESQFASLVPTPYLLSEYYGTMFSAVHDLVIYDH